MNGTNQCAPADFNDFSKSNIVALYKKFYNRLFHYLTSQGLGYVSHDAIQETFLDLCAGTSFLLRAERPCLALLKKMVRFKALNLEKKQCKHLSSPDPAPVGELNVSLIKKKADQFIAQCDCQERQIYFLLFIAGFSIAETAKHLGISVSTVSKQKTATLHGMRAYFGIDQRETDDRLLINTVNEKPRETVTILLKSGTKRRITITP